MRGIQNGRASPAPGAASAIVDHPIDTSRADELALVDPDAFFDFADNRCHAR